MMVKDVFSGVNSEGYEEELSTANAFSKGQMGRETINALQKAAMNGDDETSIAGAKMKLAGHFKTVSNDKKDEKNKGLSMAEMMILQASNDFLSALDGRIEKLEDEINEIHDAYARQKRGDFDALNNEDDAEFVREHFGIEPEQFNALPIGEQNRLFTEGIREREIELSHNKDLYRYVESNPNALTADIDGKFTDPAMATIQQAAADMGNPIDGNNMDLDDRENLILAQIGVDRAIVNEQLALGNASGNENTSSAATMESLW